MKRIALFPGSFDPFTRGHQSLVDSALQLFDQVIVAVGENVAKRGLLDIEARKRLIADLYADNERVSVASYTTLTGEFAREMGACAIIRGVRNATDFDFERSIEAVNRHLFPELTTVILVAPNQLAHISSSVIRELLAFDHDVCDFMPEGVDIHKYIVKN
ncbi:MAG: pantetheine-phosphate adenylyltransferase [Alistipes sp.]|jgi:pantetheine-phosphate adenylyltransferase|nr:pantetheine-phosphate adenylyltransferase [Alistipes sp.]